MPTAYCILHIAYCLLPIAHCLLPIAYCLLLTACCLLPLPIAYCLLPVPYCLLPTAYCLLPIAYCLLPMACGLWPMAHGPWPIAYCLLLVASCLLPTLVFMSYLQEAAVDSFQFQIEDMLEDLNDRPLNDITMMTLNAVVKKAEDLATSLKIDKILSVEHTVKTKYNKMNITNLKATSGTHHAEIVVYAWYKSRAVGKGLEPLSFEGSISPVFGPADDDDHALPDMVAEMNKARRNVEAILAAQTVRIKNSEQLQRVLNANREVWSPHDRFFLIEIAFCASAGTNDGAVLFVRRFLALLPEGVAIQWAIGISQ